ncbi:hypothetical protein XELAEV_18000492mg [Xenopus laevis]|uniref:Uncharacterized protein n=1 Tax=Xenopus laevis TaxID=8355 RepID=A0A974GZE4_XENLA|nr:hypothetical protein XELAEV_18000492mg [Xenopus laevis]
MALPQVSCSLSRALYNKCPPPINSCVTQQLHPICQQPPQLTPIVPSKPPTPSFTSQHTLALNQLLTYNSQQPHSQIPPQQSYNSQQPHSQIPPA